MALAADAVDSVDSDVWGVDLRMRERHKTRTSHQLKVSTELKTISRTPSAKRCPSRLPCFPCRSHPVPARQCSLECSDELEDGGGTCSAREHSVPE